MLPFEGAYGDVDLVVVRTRPDLPGFAKVHFGSRRRGIVCNFAHPVIITAERMRIGLSGVAPMASWPKGDPFPGMSQDEREAFKMLFGLRNQFERGNPEEREEALRGLGQILTGPPVSRLDGAPPPDTPPQVRPQPRPQFEPTPRDVQRDMDPRCRQDRYPGACLR